MGRRGQRYQSMMSLRVLVSKGMREFHYFLHYCSGVRVVYLLLPPSILAYMLHETTGKGLTGVPHLDRITEKVGISMDGFQDVEVASHPKCAFVIA